MVTVVSKGLVVVVLCVVTVVSKGLVVRGVVEVGAVWGVSAVFGKLEATVTDLTVVKGESVDSKIVVFCSRAWDFVSWVWSLGVAWVVVARVGVVSFEVWGSTVVADWKAVRVVVCSKILLSSWS